MSSAVIWPYAKRFVKAATLLKQKNIPTVEILDTFKVPSIKRDLVVYSPLMGPSLRDVVSDKKKGQQTVLEFASFFAGLHNQGIYFRAIHFNNVIMPSKGVFGLIDISDLYAYGSLPLDIKKRVRNFKPILNYQEDRQAIESVTIEQFINSYVKTAKFKSKNETEKFVKTALRFCKKRLEPKPSV